MRCCLSRLTYTLVGDYYIDTVAVDNEVADNLYQRSEL